MKQYLNSQKLRDYKYPDMHRRRVSKTNLCEFPLGQDVIMSLPDPLNSHGSSKETISYAKYGKYDNKNDN